MVESLGEHTRPAAPGRARRCVSPGADGRARTARHKGVVPAAVLGVLLVVACSSIWGARPALAHTSLISSTPAPDAVVDEPAAVVTLVFDTPVSSRRARLVVTGPGGVDVGDGPARTSGGTVSLPVGAWPTSGVFRLSYRVLAEDGHPLTGQLPFRVTSGAAAGDQAAAPSATPPTAAGPAPAPPATDPRTGTTVVPVLVAVLCALAVVLVVGGSRAGRRGAVAP